MAGPASPPRGIAEQATDLLHATVGAGLLGVQRLMVARHDARGHAEALCRTLDDTFGAVEGLLPEPAGTAMRRSRSAAHDMGRLVWVALGLDIATDGPGPSEA